MRGVYNIDHIHSVQIILFPKIEINALGVLPKSLKRLQYEYDGFLICCRVYSEPNVLHKSIRILLMKTKPGIRGAILSFYSNTEAGLDILSNRVGFGARKKNLLETKTISMLDIEEKTDEKNLTTYMSHRVGIEVSFLHDSSNVWQLENA